MLTELPASLRARVDLVGRDHELQVLGDSHQRGVGGEPAIVVVSGDAGIGKSALVSQFAAEVADQDTVVLHGGCLEGGGDALPYAPFVEIVRQLVRRLGVARVLELAGPTGPSLARLASALSIAGDGQPDDEHRVSRADLTGAVTNLLEGLSRQAPLLVVLEDLHWADPSTLELLPPVVHALGPAAAHVVVNHRADEVPEGSALRRLLAELVRGRRGRLVELGPLTREEQAKQLAEILGEPPTHAMLDGVWGRAAGNPFFAEELVAHGLDDLPVTIHDLLVGRLQALPAETRQVLSVLALAGGGIDPVLLGAVTEHDPATLDEVLRPAVHHHVLVVDRDTASLSFRHALLADVAAVEVLPSETVRLHQRLADALANGFGDVEPAERAAGIARHRVGARDWPRTLSASLTAARAMERVLAFPSALRHYERVLALWERVSDAAGITGASLGAIQQDAAEAANMAIVPDRAAELARAAIGQVDEGREPVRAALLHERLGRYLWLAADGQRAITAYERAVELVPPEPASVERARVCSGLSQMLMITGQAEAAARLADEAIAIAREVGARDVEGHARSNRGMARSYLGEVDAAVDDLTTAIEIAREAAPDDVEELLRRTFNLGIMFANLGRLQEAVDLALQAVDQDDRIGAPWAHFGTAEFLLMAGRVDEAANLIEEGRARGPKGFHELSAWQAAGALQLVRGDLGAAERALGRVGEHAEQLVHVYLITSYAEHAVELRTEQGRWREALDMATWAYERLPRRHAPSATPVAWAAVRAAVEAALDIPEPPDRAMLETAELWLERGRRMVPHAIMDHPLPRAQLATATAELDRTAEGPDPALWERAVAGWEEVGVPFRTAYCQWRRAEAVLLADGDREAAAQCLQRAADICSDLGARLVAERVHRLARQARITLEGFGDEAEDAAAAAGLTPREQDVLELVAEGLTNRQIGERLFIGHRTVGTHVSNLLAKLGAANRSEAATIAHRDGLLSH